MRGTRARCSSNVLSIFLRRVDCVYPVKPSAHAPGKATMLKRPAPARPIYQALTHLERYHSLICKMFLRPILIASEPFFDRHRSALTPLDDPTGSQPARISTPTL